MQGKKKICAIFATVILFLSGFIYVTRFDVREGLCAEAGTNIEYGCAVDKAGRKNHFLKK